MAPSLLDCPNEVLQSIIRESLPITVGHKLLLSEQYPRAGHLVNREFKALVQGTQQIKHISDEFFVTCVTHNIPDIHVVELLECLEAKLSPQPDLTDFSFQNDRFKSVTTLELSYISEDLVESLTNAVDCNAFPKLHTIQVRVSIWKGPSPVDKLTTADLDAIEGGLHNLKFEELATQNYAGFQFVYCYGCHQSFKMYATHLRVQVVLYCLLPYESSIYSSKFQIVVSDAPDKLAASNDSSQKITYNKRSDESGDRFTVDSAVRMYLPSQ